MSGLWPASARGMAVPSLRIAGPCVHYLFRETDCLRPRSFAGGAQLLQVRQRGNDSSLQQDLRMAVPPPEDERGPMIGPLVECAFIARSLRQLLPVGRLLVERALRKQLARGKRNGTKLHSEIAGVSPFVNVLPGVIDRDDGKALAFIVAVFVLRVLAVFIIFIPITIPPRSI